MEDSTDIHLIARDHHDSLVGGSDPRIAKASTLLASMIKLESTSYQCCDYLKVQHRAAVAEGLPAVLNEVWREKVCAWFYSVVDQSPSGLNREVVFIAMSILDRFLASFITNPGDMEYDMKTFYQIAAMTSLYLGAKVHYRKGQDNCIDSIRLGGDHLPIEQLLKRSSTGIRSRDIEMMEQRILNSLSWQVCPPTPAFFIRCLLTLVPSDDVVRPEIKGEISEHARYLSELSSFDYFFVGCNASTIAFAAILVAMKESKWSEELSHQVTMFLDNLATYVSKINPQCVDLTSVCSRLREVYFLSAESAQQAKREQMEEPLKTLPLTSHAAPSCHMPMNLQTSSHVPRVVSSEDLAKSSS